jgi:Kae1-associated kinase Bud32
MEKNKKIIQQGAEAIIFLDEEKDKIIKKRIPKNYRIPEIDEKIRKIRTRSETKLMNKASNLISIPKIIKSDEKTKEIIMDFVKGKKLSENLDNLPLIKQKAILKQIGKDTAKLHDKNIIHGDLTTSNMILVEELPANSLSQIDKKENNQQNKKVNLSDNKKISEKNEPIIYFIDFGLGYFNGKYEDKAVDIHLLKQALEAKHFKKWEILYKEFEKGYRLINKKEAEKTLNQLNKVEKRGRYKS